MSDSHDPMGYSLPGSSVHGILQATVLEWVAIAFCRGSSLIKARTSVSCSADRFFSREPPGKHRTEDRKQRERQRSYKNPVHSVLQEMEHTGHVNRQEATPWDPGGPFHL